MKTDLFKKLSIATLILTLGISQLSYATAGLSCEAIFSHTKESSQFKYLIINHAASQNLSQHLRDNARHYWKYMTSIRSSVIDQLVKYQGYVVGDTHAGNFILAPLKNKIEYFIADIKDSGVAPFIFDINRLLLTSDAVLEKGGYASQKEIYNNILDSYMEGLKGNPYLLTKKLNKYFETDQAYFENGVQDYILGKLKKDKMRFKNKEGKVERLESVEKERVLLQTSHLLKGSNKVLLDIAVRPRERGGSKDLLRYWALIDNKGKLELMEFKEISDPAVNEYTKQFDIQDIYQKMMEIYWPSLDKTYQVVKLDNKLFWMRPKKIDIMSVRYNQKSEKDYNFNLSLSLLAANYLGQAHAKQMPNADFLNTMVINKDQLIKTLMVENNKYDQIILDGVSETPKIIGAERDYEE